MTDDETFMARAIALSEHTALVESPAAPSGGDRARTGRSSARARNRVVAENDPNLARRDGGDPRRLQEGGQLQAARQHALHLGGAVPDVHGRRLLAGISRIFYASTNEDALRHGNFRRQHDLRGGPQAGGPAQDPDPPDHAAEAIEVWERYEAKADRCRMTGAEAGQPGPPARRCPPQGLTLGQRRENRVRAKGTVVEGAPCVARITSPSSSPWPSPAPLLAQGEPPGRDPGRPGRRAGHPATPTGVGQTKPPGAALGPDSASRRTCRRAKTARSSGRSRDRIICNRLHRIAQYNPVRTGGRINPLCIRRNERLRARSADD